MVGLGKLGYPVSLCMAEEHEVFAYDIDSDKMSHEYEGRMFGDDLRMPMDTSKYQFADLVTVVTESDIVFVAVQTPHDKRSDGTHMLNHHTESKNFDYQYLTKTVSNITAIAKDQRISTQSLL